MQEDNNQNISSEKITTEKSKSYFKINFPLALISLVIAYVIIMFNIKDDLENQELVVISFTFILSPIIYLILLLGYKVVRYVLNDRFRMILAVIIGFGYLAFGTQTGSNLVSNFLDADKNKFCVKNFGNKTNCIEKLNKKHSDMVNALGTLSDKVNAALEKYEAETRYDATEAYCKGFDARRYSVERIEYCYNLVESNYKIVSDTDTIIKEKEKERASKEKQKKLLEALIANEKKRNDATIDLIKKGWEIDRRFEAQQRARDNIQEGASWWFKNTFGY